MQLMGFSLNVIISSALVLGVGMMDNLLWPRAVLRATDDTGFQESSKAALNGTGVVYQSVIGSTLTTCAVFLPPKIHAGCGMTGQMFRPLGYHALCSYV